MLNCTCLKLFSPALVRYRIARLLQRRWRSVSDSPLKRLLAESATYNEREVVDPELEWATLPYTSVPGESQAPRPKVDPRHTSVVLFPGQGSQYVGMGKSLLKYPLARDVFAHASEILKMDILKLCMEGPEAELRRHCQLCVIVTSLASLERLREERPSAIDNCAATAGFSLGEITALVFAGALRFDQATAMEAASQDHPSGMITIMYGPDSKVNYAILRAKQHCQQQNMENIQCQVANYLYPHCKVIAGSEPALQYIEDHSKEFGIRRVQRLKVSGAFHTEVMRSAVEPVRAALALCEVDMPTVPVISNVDGRPYRSEKHIRLQLPKQIVRAVRWEQCLHNLFSRSQEQNFPQTFTVGPGTSLRSILRQVNAKAWDSSVQIDS